MYETTLSVPTDNGYILQHIGNALRIPLLQAKATVACSQNGNRNYMSVACADIYKSVVCDAVANAVAESLSVSYKNSYIRELLAVKNGSFFQNVLVSVICVFDCAKDKQAVLGLVKNDEQICLDGYYNFRMREIKRKWWELTTLVGANRYVLEDDELVLEFLQYLNDSVSGSVGETSVVFSGSDFFIFDKQNKLRPTLQTNASFDNSVDSAEVQAAVNLVCIKPTQVNVYSAKRPGKDFCRLIDELFATTYTIVD